MDNRTVIIEPQETRPSGDYQAWLANQSSAETVRRKKRNRTILICGIAAVVLLMVIGIWRAGSNSGSGSTLNFTSDYIAVLDVNGEISSSPSGGSDHAWTIKMIDSLMADDYNKGIFLRVDSPGGSVYESDELYLKFMEYKEKTGRPIYAYYGSMAASGRYYVSVMSDKIYANRNCWTGSIGVTLGTMYDFSGLLERYGVKVNTITSGANKAMGSEFIEMTDEQRAIFQSLVDEAYDQFVGIVAEGRGMSVAQVKKIADGRILTAKQAMEADLIDAIGDERDARATMKADCGLDSADFQELAPEETTSVLTYFTQARDNQVVSEIDMLMELIKRGGTFEISYRANISR